MLTDAADIIFRGAQKRCWVERPPPIIQKQSYDDPDQDAWDVLDEIDEETRKEKEKRPAWLPPTMNPILEELPKWRLLVDVLDEIEVEIVRYEEKTRGKGK